MLVDDKPYQLGDSYYRQKPREGHRHHPVDIGRGAVLSVLERAYGKPISYYIDDLSFRMPSSDEAAILKR